ncbi:hypothetical protein [Brevundimonas vesicularis]|uniref:hypothetical protein n=1 Tax=Brevundimonas vesicularis TaxID=41276 RepID=UPI00385090A7
MERLTPIEHANLARRLIEAVGGLERASRLCRVNATVLSNYQNPNMPGVSMPADVMSDLQVAAGTALYSDAQAAEVDRPQTMVADPMHHACGLVKEAADVLGAVQTSLSDGNVSAADFSNCDRELADLEERIAILRAGLRGAHLRAVG